MSMKLPLSKGKETIVDDDDYEFFKQWKWSCSYDGYACRSTSSKLGKRKQLKLHREILKAVPGTIIDHINRNKLDNRKENLRVVERSGQNQMNIDKPRGYNTSKYKGVSRQKGRNRYYAHIRINKKQIFLGSFKTELEAAKVYNEAALKHHGKYARINKL